MRVLIADDDRVLVHLLCAEFRKCGWNVVQAFDAMQAIMFTNRPPRPDAVVLDLGMPGGTGFGVLEKLARSARTSSIPVIVVTGSDEARAERYALGKGAAAFLRKPVKPDALVEEIEAAVNGSPA